jgi:hypothetical protein
MTSQIAEKVVARAVLKGHEFIRANKWIALMTALAAEGRFLPDSPEISSFSAACSVVPQKERKATGLTSCGKTHSTTAL